MSPQQEVAMGLQAAPEMAAQHGGSYPDPELNALVDKVGAKLVAANSRGAWAEQFAKYRFDFHLLRDAEMVNAFALPGGQIFFTYGLLKELNTEDDVAGVLGHEIGHVVGRHSAEQMARSQLWAGIAQAAGMAGADFNLNPQQIAGLVYQVKTTSYGREDENQADDLGVRFMVNAGYNPEALINVMQVLKAKGGAGGGPEFLKTHPDPGNRIEHIKKVIEDVNKNGTGIDRPATPAR
jgi:predicted Zn-dependent protease